MSTLDSLSPLAHFLNGLMHNNALELIQGMAPLSLVNNKRLAFFDNLTPLESFKNSRPGVVLSVPKFAPACTSIGKHSTARGFSLEN